MGGGPSGGDGGGAGGPCGIGGNGGGRALRFHRTRKTVAVTAAITITVEIAVMRAQFKANRAPMDRGWPSAIAFEATPPARSPVHPVNTQKTEEGMVVRFTVRPANT